jgi:hypothetical protein
MWKTQRISFAAVFLVVSLLIIPLTAQAGDIIINHFGFLYETGGFPTSAIGDELTGVGVLTNVNPAVGWDFQTDEFTWIIKDLVSEGQTSPDGGRTLIISYTGGSIGLYNDPAMNHDWGINPPNATSPSSFEDGDQILIGAFSQFVMMYDTFYNIGSYQGVVYFTGGSSLAELPDSNGLVFAGTISPNWDPNIPEGYSLESIGQIVAPYLVSAQGHVDFECVPSACVDCIGITELVLNYTGSEDINTATLDFGTLVIQGNQLIITPDAGESMLPEDIEVAVGTDYAIIHTSCSQPIEPGNVIESFVISSVDKTLIPCEDEMCNGVTRMVLLYFGAGDPSNVVVSDNYTVSVNGDLITITPEPGHDTLKGNATINIDGDETTIHTSCSQPLEVGFVFGNYEVFELDVLPGDGSGVFPSGGPIVGATVDLVDNEGNIFSTTTDENGDYFFNDVAGETLRVSITVPLGYLPNSETSVVRIVQPGDVTFADFHFVCEGTLDEPRSKGFWKHQVNFALKGKTKGIKHTGEELLAFLAIIHDRFDPYFSIYADVNDLESMLWILSQNPEFRKKATQYDKAKAQFLALLLNVVSSRSATWQYASEDNATIAQAITYVAELMQDGDPVTDAIAKNIAESIVLGMLVPAGEIPLSTPGIAYAYPRRSDPNKVTDPQIFETNAIESFVNFPNPFNPVTTISYELVTPVHVSLTIYNVNGQKVKDLVQNQLQSGLNAVVWNTTDNSGNLVASGIYFAQLKAGQSTYTKRLVLIR